MRNLDLVFNYENEFYGISGLEKGRTTIIFTDSHLHTLSYFLLNNPSFITKVDFLEVFKFFGETAMDSDFKKSWKFEFDRIKPDFLYEGDFPTDIHLPKEKEETLSFWNSLYLNENPIFYVSAINGAWGLEGWSATARNLTVHWKMKKETPFFKFSTLSDAAIDKNNLPEEFNYLYVILENYQDFEYIGELPKITTEFIQNFNSSINANLPQLCFN